MQHRMQLFLIAVVILFLWVPVHAQEGISAKTYPETRSAQAGILSTTIGKVLVQRKNSMKWMSAQNGKPLYEGDTIKTLDDSLAAVVLSDGSAIRVNGQSKVCLMPRNPGAAARIRISSGQVWARTNKPKNKLIIETMSAAASMQGGECELGVDSSNTSDLLVREGMIRFYNSLGEVQVRAAQKSRAASNQPPEKARTVELAKFEAWYESIREKPEHAQKNPQDQEEQSSIVKPQTQPISAISRTKPSITNIKQVSRSKKIVAGQNANASLGEVIIQGQTNVKGKITNITDINESGNMAVGNDSEVKAGSVSSE